MRKGLTLFGLLALAAVPAAAGAAPRPPADLGVYKGEYAFHPVRGYRFLRHPKVRRAVLASAPTRAAADRILQQTQLTSVPIKASGSWLLYGGCEQHVCPHQWSVLIDRRGAGAYVCYADHNQPGRWYRRGRLIVDGQEGCPTEFDKLPAAVASAL